MNKMEYTFNYGGKQYTSIPDEGGKRTCKGCVFDTSEGCSEAITYMDCVDNSIKWKEITTKTKMKLYNPFDYKAGLFVNAAAVLISIITIVSIYKILVIMLGAAFTLCAALGLILARTLYYILKGK